MLWRKLARGVVAIGRERTLAAAAHVSKFHFTRRFADAYGETPMRYLTRRRIERIRRRCSDRSASTARITASLRPSMSCGFTR